MLSAAEARMKTNYHRTLNAELEMLTIEEQINEAVSKGRSFITNSGTLQHETKQKLKELGYIVTIGNQYNDFYYTIAW